jgi:phosphoglycolate phosphatase
VTPFAIFDLDGTLLDSVPLCADIINGMLVERGSSTLVSQDDARRYASLGGTSLVAALLGDFGDDPERDVAAFRERYRALPTPRDSLFPGVRHGLDKLHAQGCLLAICSNKPQSLCEKVIDDLGLAPLFEVIVGARPTLPLKPHPASVDLVLRELRADRDDGCYVGDSELDYAAARAASIRCVMVTYGYAIGDQAFEDAFLAEDFARVVSLIENFPASRHAGRVAN